MDNIKQVKICLSSFIDGEETYNEYSGEYAFKDDVHNIVFTDYAGNAVTKTGIQANDRVMLLHRVGGFSGDMMFDTLTDTVVRYEAFELKSGFLLHTYKYNLNITDNRITIFADYGLNDGSDEEIHGTQSIEVIF